MWKTNSIVQHAASRVVRNLPGSVRRPNIERGVYISLINSRGVTCRRPGQGGSQESNLAADFRDQAQRALQSNWPITSRILTQIADRYDHEASSENESAERFQTGIIQ